MRRHANRYYAHMDHFPYYVYLNWPATCQADIFSSDRKFVTALYAARGKKFQDFALVTDSGYATSADVSSFLRANAPAAIAVDCENADPYKLYAMLVSLDQAALLGHISKVILYTGPNACAVWNLLDCFTGLTVERHVLERLKENKSLVDIQTAAGVTREFYQNGTKSFILASSDSDYWGLISTLPEANYLVVIEEEKCGPSIKQALESANIMYYSMDNFYPSDRSRSGTGTLLRQLAAALPEALTNLQVQELLDSIRQSARLLMSESEWQQFYNRFIRPLRGLFPAAEQPLPQMC